MFALYRSVAGILASQSSASSREAEFRLLRELSWDGVFTAENPLETVADAWSKGTAAAPVDLTKKLLPPIGSQEVWAAGVTYFRSRTARMEESESSGADRFYNLVYEADRPEIFYKGNGSRARGHLEPLRFRKDSAWNVPEPEFTLAINSTGHIFGYTIGNDMSSRDIEGANPLYLPQAKVYRGSLGIGPCLIVGPQPAKETAIRITILRQGNEVFLGDTTLSQLKRTPEELAEWLYRENEFPVGTYLLTGTGIVPPGQWTLASGDTVSIEIETVGILTNSIE